MDLGYRAIIFIGSSSLLIEESEAVAFSKELQGVSHHLT